VGNLNLKPTKLFRGGRARLFVDAEKLAWKFPLVVSMADTVGEELGLWLLHVLVMTMMMDIPALTFENQFIVSYAPRYLHAYHLTSYGIGLFGSLLKTVI
jgi:hypothetical protein